MTLRVRVAYAAPGCEAVVEVVLPDDARLADAVAAAGLVARLDLDAGQLAYSVFGQGADPGTPLRDGDRVELLRPLQQEPKAARRLRAARHPGPGGRRASGAGNGGGG